ncbi:MAG: tRNA (adenosine(37)-N6)-dimethylallyltransferase MiaA [Spirochaetota bacterium]
MNRQTKEGSSAQKVIILGGATAVGKTAALQKIQQYITKRQAGGIEVINCDSVQVYRHLNIASAKPTKEVRDSVPHHLVDILELREKFTAGYFVRQCDKLIPEIVARGNIPIISGGTVFYLKSFLYGLADIPPLSGHFRSRLEAMSCEELQHKLQTLDIKSSQRIHPHDRQRLLRACEVSWETGRPFSGYPVPTKIRGQYQPFIITLNLARETLYRRINQRVEEMFEQGLEQEIAFLKNLGYSGKEQGLQGIGYREFFRGNTEDKGQILAQIQQNSRNYAKRQQTFLHQLAGSEVYDVNESKHIAQRIEGFYFGMEQD